MSQLRIYQNDFGNDLCRKMTRMAHKKKISDSTVCKIVEKMGGKSLKPSRKPLLSAAMIQKRMEKNTHLLNDPKKHGNRVLNFFNKKAFTVDPVSNK